MPAWTKQTIPFLLHFDGVPEMGTAETGAWEFVGEGMALEVSPFYPDDPDGMPWRWLVFVEDEEWTSGNALTRMEAQEQAERSWQGLVDHWNMTSADRAYERATQNGWAD